jgi:hypothetical protein
MKAGRTDRAGATGRVHGFPRRALLLTGSVWEAVRFFLVLLLLALLLDSEPARGPWLFPWLLFGASGNLLVAAGGILMAAFPSRYDGLTGLLRLGKALSVFAVVLLLASGGLGIVADREVAVAGPLAITLGPVLLGIFALDLLHLAVLLWMRGGFDAAPPAAGEGGRGLPGDEAHPLAGNEVPPLGGHAG